LTLIMQNKANFPQAEMNTSSIITNDYEKRCAFRVEQKQSQTKPISKQKSGDRRKKTAVTVQSLALRYPPSVLCPLAVR